MKDKITDKKQAPETDANVNEDLNLHNRRRALGAIATGGAVILGNNAPETWVKPVIDHMILPAHAQMSALGTIVPFMIVTGDDDPDGATIFNAGDTTSDLLVDEDDPVFSFTAQLIPPAAVAVTMQTTADTDFDFGDLNDTQDVTSTDSGAANFSSLDSDDGANDPAVMQMTFSAPGYQTNVIRVTFNS